MKRIGLMIAVLGLFLFAQTAQADWTPAKRLTWSPGGSGGQMIAVDSYDNLNMVYHDNTPGNFEIFYKRSKDGGSTWSPAKRLTFNSGRSVFPAIAADPTGNLHVVWPDDTPGNGEIYYTMSMDGGTSWTASKRLTWTSGGATRPAIAVDKSGYIHVVWQGLPPPPGLAEIYYMRSTNGGVTWTASRRLTWTSGWSLFPEIAVDSFDNLHIVWPDCTPGYHEIYYKKSTDGGGTWTCGKRTTWTSGDSMDPAIALDSSGNPHLVWYEETFKNHGTYYAWDFEIYYKKSTDGGTTWPASSQNLSWPLAQSGYPAVAVDSFGNLHVVWCDESFGSHEIYYKNSTDGGATWIIARRISWTSGESLSPGIASDSLGNLHVVWGDNTPGNSEIYYKKFVK